MAPRRHPSLVPLSRDHRDALALAFRLHHPSPPGPATAVTPPSTPAGRAAEVLDFFVVHLDGHFRAEEVILFPAIEAHVAPDAPTAVLLHALRDEHRLLAQLRDAIAGALDADDDTRDARLAAPLQELADVLERHVRREERELFAEFPVLVPESEASALSPRIDEVLRARPLRP